MERRTRALGQSHLQDLLGVVVGTGLGSAVTDTVGVVLALAQAVHVTGLAAQFGGLGVHVGDTHRLSRQFNVSSRTSRPRTTTGTYSALRGRHIGGDHTGGGQKSHSNGGEGLHRVNVLKRYRKGRELGM